MPDIVIGLGEIGNPLADIISIRRSLYRRDIEPLDIDPDTVDVMHICYPYSMTFCGSTAYYINQYNPQMVIIHSTVVPGTTRKIDNLVNCDVLYSPVRGRHTEMLRDLYRYTKFVSGKEYGAMRQGVAYFTLLGMKSKMVFPCEALELAKLAETTYSALLIAYAQEVDRYCETLGADLNDVMSFTDEIAYLPDHKFFPGYIGGHCLMQNLDLLEQVRKSPVIDMVRQSNEMCTQRQKSGKIRYKPQKNRD